MIKWHKSRQDEKQTNMSGAVRLGRQTIMSEVMSRTLMGKLWHAFVALTRNKTGDNIERSKAKVLTQSLISVMQLQPTVMKNFDGLFPDEHYQEGVSFNDFREFVTCHLLAKVILEEHDEEMCFEIDTETEEVLEQKGKEKNGIKEKKEDTQEAGTFEPPSAPALAPSSSPDAVKRTDIVWDDLDNFCWTLFSKQALSPTYSQQLSEESLHLLWQWYVTYADTDAAGIVKCPVLMDCDELNFWLQYLFGDLLALEIQPLPFEKPIGLAFNEVLDAIMSLVIDKRVNHEELKFVLKEFHMEMIDGVLKKGFLYKGKRNLMKSQWKRRYCVLTLRTFAYFTDENMSDKKGQIPLSQIISADPYRDRYSKLTRYQIETENALFILEAEDLRSRNQWIRDIRYAIQCCRRQIENVNFIKSESRKSARRERRKKETEELEERKRVKERIQNAEVKNEELAQEIAIVKSELVKEERQRQEEERARIVATQDLQSQLRNVTDTMTNTMQKIEEEKKTKEEELEMERQRVMELQLLHSELESALQEEQRLRKHEESVMRMQAQLMQEQVEARERLEAMRQEQEQLLATEIQKRAQIQVELAEQNEQIACTERQLGDFAKQLQASEEQKSELFNKLTTLEKKINTPVPQGSHRGPGAFAFFKYPGSKS